MWIDFNMVAEKDELICIVGAGPAGLGAAMAFHKAGFTNVHVYERAQSLKQSAEESYPIGINTRGVSALRKLIDVSEERVFNLGLIVNSWDIFVGKWQWRVARFESGKVIGTTRSAVIDLLLEEVKCRNAAVIHYGHEAKSVDLSSKTVLFSTALSNSESEVLVKPYRLVVADGYRSRIRDQLAAQCSSLKVKQWPWNTNFRVLLSDQDDESNSLDPNIHHIVNGIYIARTPDRRWVAVPSCRTGDPSTSFLMDKEGSEANCEKLKSFLSRNAPMTCGLFSEEEMKRFFKRRTFTGAVTRVSDLCVENWALLIGDAAHAVIPATGEGVNCSLEDAAVLQDVLLENQSCGLKENIFQVFQERRIDDVHALGEIAFSYLNRNVKSIFQSVAAKVFRLGKSKEELMYGPNSDRPLPYSEIVNAWTEQTKWIGGRAKIPNSD